MAKIRDGRHQGCGGTKDFIALVSNFAHPLWPRAGCGEGWPILRFHLRERVWDGQAGKFEAAVRAGGLCSG